MSRKNEDKPRIYLLRNNESKPQSIFDRPEVADARHRLAIGIGFTAILAAGDVVTAIAAGAASHNILAGVVVGVALGSAAGSIAVNENRTAIRDFQEAVAKAVPNDSARISEEPWA